MESPQRIETEPTTGFLDCVQIRDAVVYIPQESEEAMTSGLWFRTIIVFCITAVLSYFLLGRFLERDWAFVGAAALALVSVFLSSKLSRVVLDESIKYPRSSSEVEVSSSQRKAKVVSRK